MAELDSLWREKSDEEIAEAMENIADYTAKAQSVIRAEFTRRGITLPAVEEDEGDSTEGVDAPANDDPNEDDVLEAVDPLLCARCQKSLEFVGSKRFHEGTNWGILGELGELFVKRERFDVYVCPRCGKVEFFVDGIGEDMRTQ